MDGQFRAFALCTLGLEKVLSAEIERLGLTMVGRAPGRAYFDADLAGLFRADLCLRTAERVLIEAARFNAVDFDELFDNVRPLPWERYIGPEDKLVIERVRIHDSRIDSQTSVQSIVHKAIYEHLGELYGTEVMPETGSNRSARVYIEANECLIGVDISGDALHKRGYRRSPVEAPLKETLAAASLLLAGWNRRIPLVDLFCGSGTILIEAALFGMDIAPGLGRSFSIEDMPLADPAVFMAERDAAKARIRTDADLILLGTDKDETVLEAARLNARLAGVADKIVFRRAAAEDVEPLEDKGYVISNPPYGLRLGTTEEAEELYRGLGAIAPRFKGWGLGFVTIRKDFGDFFGRRATAEHKMVNGAEEQWFHWFPPGYEDTKAREPAMTAGEKVAKAAKGKGKGKSKYEAKRPFERPRSRDEGDRRPASSGYDRRPSSSGPDRNPYSAGPDRRPSPGAYGNRPASSGYDRRPSSGGPERKPYSTDPDRRPGAGGYGSRPASGGYERRPAPSGYDRRPAPSGYDRRPAPGGYDRGTPRDEGERRPASSGYDRRPPRPEGARRDEGERRPASGSYERKPPRREDGQRPVTGSYVRPSQRDVAERRPSNGAYFTRTASGSYEKRPEGGGYGGKPPSGGYERRPPSGGYDRRPTEGEGEVRPLREGYEPRVWPKKDSGSSFGGANGPGANAGRRESYNKNPAPRPPKENPPDGRSEDRDD